MISFQDKYQHLVGMTVGKLTITGFVKKKMKTQAYTVLVCRCECGNESTWFKGNLFRSKMPQCFACNYKSQTKYKVGCILPNGAILKKREKIPGTNRTLLYYDCNLCGKNLKTENFLNNPRGICQPCASRTSRYLRGRRFEFNGETKNMSEWARYFGVSRERVRQLIKKLSPEDALSYLHRKYILKQP